MNDDSHSAETLPGAENETDRLSRGSIKKRQADPSGTLHMAASDSHTAETLPGSMGRTGQVLTRDEIEAAKKAMADDTASIPRPRFEEQRRFPAWVLIAGGLLALVCIVLAIAVLVFGLTLPGVGDSDQGGGGGDTFQEDTTPEPPTDEPTPIVTEEVTATPTPEPACECQGTALWCGDEKVGDDVAECRQSCQCQGTDLVCGQETYPGKCAGGSPPVCQCQGLAMVCGDEVVLDQSLNCTLDLFDCHCEGTAWVCGSVTVETDALNCSEDGDGGEDQPSATPTEEAVCICQDGTLKCDDGTEIPLYPECLLTDEPTEEPTPEVTEAPTEVPTEAPTEDPGGNGNRP